MSDKEKTHKLPNQEKWINLTRLELKRIFVYYIVLFFIALVTMILFIRRFTLTEVDEVQIFETTLFSFVSGLLGATFYYIRKLYKCGDRKDIADFEGYAYGKNRVCNKI